MILINKVLLVIHLREPACSFTLLKTFICAHTGAVRTARNTAPDVDSGRGKNKQTNKKQRQAQQQQPQQTLNHLSTGPGFWVKILISCKERA